MRTIERETVPSLQYIFILVGHNVFFLHSYKVFTKFLRLLSGTFLCQLQITALTLQKPSVSTDLPLKIVCF